MYRNTMEWRWRPNRESLKKSIKKQAGGLLLAGVITAPLVFSPLLLATVWHTIHSNGITRAGFVWKLPWPWVVLPEAIAGGNVEALKMPIVVSNPKGKIYFWSNDEPRPNLYHVLKRKDSQKYRLLVERSGSAESYCAVPHVARGLEMFCQLRNGAATLQMYGRQSDYPLFMRTMALVASNPR